MSDKRGISTERVAPRKVSGSHPSTVTVGSLSCFLSAFESFRVGYISQCSTMSPSLSVKGKESGAARILGSGTSGMCAGGSRVSRSADWRAGVAELLVFHPVDTIAKRLMSNKAKVRSGSPAFKCRSLCSPPARSPSRTFRRSSSASTQRLRSRRGSSRCSPGSGTPRGTRSHSGYTSTAGSRISTTSSRRTTRRSSRTRLASAKASS